MVRKKSSASATDDVIDGIPELNDDEQFVIENHNRKTVRKERTPKAKPEPEPEVEIIDNEEFDERPTFSQTSLAALQFSDDEEFENQYCNIQVRRMPDSMNDHFVNPNSAVLRMAPLRMIEMTADQSDIEEKVRELHGGGHYFFQIQLNGNLGKSWKATLADSPQAIAAAKAAADPPTAQMPPPAVPAVNPIDAFLDALGKQKQLRDLLFGDEQKRLEKEIEELKAEAARADREPAEPKSEKLTLIEAALAANNNPTLQEKLLDYVFPPEPESAGGHWIAETIKAVFEHKEEIGGLLGMLFGGMAQPRPPAMSQPPPMPSIEHLLKAEPPAPAASIRNPIRRPIAPPETELPANDIGSDAAGMEAAESADKTDDANNDAADNLDTNS